MNLAALFEDRALAHADAIALTSSRADLTWAALRDRAARLARALRARGVAREGLVGVCVPRSLASVTAVYGVLRAGGAYVPVDPAHPAERQRFVADDAGLSALIYDGAQGPAPAWADPSLTLDLASLDAVEPLPFDAREHPSDALLNVLYTSGSTGRPKGVCGTHAAMLHRLRWQWDALPFAPGDVVGHRSSLGFVDAGPEMFGGVLAGVPTAVILPEELADLARLVAALRAQRVTRLTLVPSLLAALVRGVDALGGALPRLRTWVSSGEALTPALLAAFRASHPRATLVNLYGSTEVTGDVTAAVFPPDAPLPTGDVPIGRALGGSTLHVLDARGAPVADGEAGELYVAGPLLARGYHRRPHEEAMRFVHRPERSFRTGDLVRRRPDGALSYVGRVDHQVKLRGVRVELEEVERRVLAASPALAAVAAVVADERLTAFVTPAGADLTALRDAAARALPAVMVPARFVAVAALPLLANGKVDRRALAALAGEGARSLPPERLPRTEAERALASLWSPLLGRRNVARDDTFASLGGDSLALAELMLALERAFPRARPTLVDARERPLHELARLLDGGALPPRDFAAAQRLTLTPLDAGADDPAVVAMVVEASHDEEIRAPTELPARMSEADARGYCRAHEGVVIRVDGAPAGVGVVSQPPSAGEGVEVPAGSVQLEEWLLAKWRAAGILTDGGAWPLLRDWLAARYDVEVSVVWEDHLAMLAILRARGYERLGRSYWTAPPGGDGSSGHCEVWRYDLRAWREGKSSGPARD